MIDVIIIVLGLAALAGLWLIARRKYDKLRHLDVKSLKKEREQATKHEIITRRLERKFTRGGVSVVKILAPISQKVINGMRRSYRKVASLEKQYNKTESATGSNEPMIQSTSIKLSTEIDELLEKKEYALAERKIIEIISHTPKDPTWYRRLGDVYMQIRQYDQAKETFEFVVSLDDKIQNENEIINGTANVEKASDYINLALALKEIGDLDNALEKVEKACRLESNNPRNLDLLFEMGILAGNKVLAWEAHDRLKQVNPENQKLTEMEDKLKEFEVTHPTIRPTKE